VVGLAFIVSLGLQFGLNKSEWASWAQAVVTGVAIFGSAWIARWQFQQHVKHQEDLAKLSDLNAARRLVAMLGRAHANIEDHWDHFVKPYEGSPYTHLEIARTVTDRERVPTPGSAELEFLLRVQNGANLYGDVGELGAHIGQWIEFTARRAAFFETQLDPRVRAEYEKAGRKLNVLELVDKIGPFLDEAARAQHANAITAINIAREQLMSLRPRILSELDAAFPGQNIGAAWPERGELMMLWKDPGIRIGFKLVMAYRVKAAAVFWRLQVFEADGGGSWSEEAGEEPLAQDAGHTAGRAVAEAKLREHVDTKMPKWSEFLAKGKAGGGPQPQASDADHYGPRR
jgi:hypothetical protein